MTFDIDANGIVSVAAKDKATGKEQQVRIQASGGLSKDEIERMVQDAESHAAEDKDRRDLAEAKNQAEALIHQTEKQLVDLGDKVSAEDRSAVEAGIAALKGVTGSENASEIQAKTQALLQAAMKMGEALYGAQSGQGGGEPEGNSGADDVVDAEFEEVDENGKKRA